MGRKKIIQPVTAEQRKVANAVFARVGKSHVAGQSSLIKAGFSKFEADNILANMLMQQSWQALSVSCREEQNREPKPSRFVSLARAVSKRVYHPVIRWKVIVARENDQWQVLDEEKSK